MKKSVIIYRLIFIFILLNTRWFCCKGCIPSEREALLNFKHSLINFDQNVSSSWEGDDCCKWRRVGCDNSTGNILKLHLNGDVNNHLFEMEKTESLAYLLELKQLESLDLSVNNFNYNSIPKFMGLMTQLRYLDLSSSFLGGLVPHELGNLTDLRVLDLRGDYEIVVDSLVWVSGLRELRYLNMDGADMSTAYDWLESLIGPLPYIMELGLSFCGLTSYKAAYNNSFPAPLTIRYLDLSRNNFRQGIPRILQNLTSLEHLDLSSSVDLTQFDLYDNQLFDLRNLWDLVHNLCALRSLDMSENYLQSKFLQPHQNLSNNCDNHYDLEDLSITSSSLIGDIPAWLSKDFGSLRSIDLSDNKLSGEIPSSLGNISILKELHLSGNMLLGEIPASLGKLSNLKVLNLSQNNLASIPVWLGEDFRSLLSIDLSDNKLSGEIPSSLGNISTLKEIWLSGNMLSGEIPASLGKLSNLKVLDLSQNNLSYIPSSLRFSSNLKTIDLSSNQLSGKIPISIGQLTKLQILDISSNPLEGTVLSELHFANLSSMRMLHMKDTFLTLSISSNWVPPFQLQALLASNCKINGQLPPWLKTQKYLVKLDLSNANVSGLMPRWLHTVQPLRYLNLPNNKLIGSPIFPINFFGIDLSNNSLSGDFLLNDSNKEVYRHATITNISCNFISGSFPKDLGHIMPNLENLDLSNNQFNGQIPDSIGHIMPNLTGLYLSNNRFSGPIPKFLGHIMPNLEALFLSNNTFNGPVPTSLCQLTSLSTLDIQKNRLSGVIPNCWGNASNLDLVNLSYNKLEGQIPCMGGLFLHLNDNLLSGEIPSCLSDPTALEVLDLGGNQLSGKMADWFTVERFGFLKILRLRGNKLSGSVPWQLCSLSSLQLLDLGYNHFTGSIPPCLSSLTAMNSPYMGTLCANLRLLRYSGLNEVIQGIERAYTNTLPYLIDIDLSCNNFVGSIPDDITNLSGLLSLNLSHNQLSGTIPQNIGGLKSLISLDLSNNKLRGTIPRSMADLYKLSHLNLSYNNLSGQIPTGNQLQTLSDVPSIYAGNPYLCGDSLPKKCKSEIDEQNSGTRDEGNGQEENKGEKLWFDLVVMSGVATGFWGVVGSLLLKRSWRHALFRHVDAAYDWVYVGVAVRMAKLNKNKNLDCS